MNHMTAVNLRSAFGGEAMANMRYKIWSKKALEEGYKNIARLFEAISFAEEVHGSNHFKEFENVEGNYIVASEGGFGLTTTSENLQRAIDGENFEIEQMYPAYIAVAKEQQEKRGLLSFQYALEAEKIHSAMFSKAKQYVDQGEDMELGDVQICTICGHTVEGPIPEICPICGVTQEHFVTFPEE
jgi:rubrerythrin